MPLTDTIPKILLPIAGEPLLSRQLRYLAAQGVTDVAVNLHYHARRVEGFLQATIPPLRVHVFHEPTLLGTAGALVPMAAFLIEPFVLLYGDVVTDANLGDLHGNLRGVATLAYYECDDVRGKGVIEVDCDGRIVRFAEKPEASGPGLVNAGIYVLEPSIVSLLRPGDDFGFDVWPAALAAGVDVFGCGIDAYVADIGSHDALRRVDDDARNSRFAW